MSSDRHAFAGRFLLTTAAVLTKVLAMEADAALAAKVTSSLVFEGYAVSVVASAAAAIRHTDLDPTALAVIDTDADHEAVTAMMHLATTHVPMLIIGAREDLDRVAATNATGASDVRVLAKPFSMSDLVIRLGQLRQADGTPPQTVSYGSLELFDDTFEARHGDRTIELTPTEFGLLRYLAANAPRVVSKQQILDYVWRYDFEGDSAVIETYISYLRRKLETSERSVIRTVRGIGYSLRRVDG